MRLLWFTKDRGRSVCDPESLVYQAGEIPGSVAPTREAVTVTVGGTTLAATDVLYAGVVPGSISGLYQINIRIPASTADGEIPVVLRVGGQATQSNATLTVKRQLRSNRRKEARPPGGAFPFVGRVAVYVSAAL